MNYKGEVCIDKRTREVVIFVGGIDVRLTQEECDWLIRALNNALKSLNLTSVDFLTLKEKKMEEKCCSELMQAIEAARCCAMSCTEGRELSLVRTKLDEARLWCEECMKAPTNVAVVNGSDCCQASGSCK